MAEGCGANFSRIVLFVVNVFVWISSIILIAIGGYVLNNSSKYENLFGDDNNTLTVVCGVIIGVGCFIFLVGFLGCCGAAVENKLCLGFYFAILLVLVIIEFVGGILAFVYRSDIEDFIQKNLLDQVVNEYGEENHKVITEAIDDLQEDEMCCGVNNYTDYQNSSFRRENPQKAVPRSCCQEKYRGNEDCNKANNSGEATNVAMINTDGCMNKLIDLIDDNLVYIGVSALVLLLVQFTAMTMSCCLINSIRKKDYHQYA